MLDIKVAANPQQSGLCGLSILVLSTLDEEDALGRPIGRRKGLVPLPSLLAKLEVLLRQHLRRGLFLMIGNLGHFR